MYNNVSARFKEAMNEPLRNRMFLQVSLGVVNQDAQRQGTFDEEELTVWSNPQFPWGNKKVDCEYATLEENYFRADGTMRFLPEGEYLQYDPSVGIASKEIKGSITVHFPVKYDLKGITLTFGSSYPTRFNIITEEGTKTYDNDARVFSTTDNLGYTRTLTIEPLEMVGGRQRLRIENILMGVGLNYTNAEIQKMNYTEKNNAVSEEVPSATFDLTITDPEQIYDVDKVESFINFLQTGQKMSMSIGLELDDGSVEYIPVCQLLLSTWSSRKGIMSFNAVDKFTLMDDDYDNGYTIEPRTLYDCATVVLTFMGFAPDEYIIDDCLRDVVTNAPLPRIPCRELLQLIANAGRCIVYQNREGQIVFKANFGTVIDPDDVVVESTTQAAWSKPQNVTHGAQDIYADLTRNFFSADGSMKFKPENGEEYGSTGYVSAEISDENGNFSEVPSLTLKLQAGFVYYGLTVVFGGNPPAEMQIDTYYLGEHVQTVTRRECEPTTYLADTFETFDEMTISFPVAYPCNRVLVQKVTFGELTDYELTYSNIIGDVLGFRDSKIKNVLVKIYSYENNEDNEPQEIQDDVYYSYNVNTSGQNVRITNPLIDSEQLAEQVAEWLGFYYSNNVFYTLDYRGDPRLNASDLVYLESNVLNNLQAEIESHKLTFDGTLQGSLELRRAIRVTNT